MYEFWPCINKSPSCAMTAASLPILFNTTYKYNVYVFIYIYIRMRCYPAFISKHAFFFKGPASILLRNSLEGSSILQCPVRRTWKREWNKKHAIITWPETPQLQTQGPQAKVAVVHEPGAASNVKRCKKVRLVCGKCVNIYVSMYFSRSGNVNCCAVLPPRWYWIKTRLRRTASVSRPWATNGLHKTLERADGMTQTERRC